MKLKRTFFLITLSLSIAASGSFAHALSLTPPVPGRDGDEIDTSLLDEESRYTLEMEDTNGYDSVDRSPAIDGPATPYPQGANARYYSNSADSISIQPMEPSEEDELIFEEEIPSADQR